LPFTRRSLFKLSASVALTAIAVDSSVLEPNSPKLVELTLPIKRLPAAWDGFRIAQLSDFHYDEDFSVVPLRKAVEVINTVKPDLIVLTGDFVTAPLFVSRRKKADEFVSRRNKAADLIDPCAQLLTKLKARLGLYACLGNHDASTDPDRIFNTLQSHNITVLRNHSVPFEKEGKRLWLAGVDDVINGSPDLDITLQTAHTLYSNEAHILEMLPEVDLLIGAVLVPGARAPKLISREMLRVMKPGSVFVDIAIDQGGCAETSRPTTHHDTIFEEEEVTHYCVANMPAAYSRTSTQALTNVTHRYVETLADHGVPGAFRRDPNLLGGLNLANGKVTHRAVADAHGMEYTDPKAMFGI